MTLNIGSGFSAIAAQTLTDVYQVPSWVWEGSSAEDALNHTIAQYQVWQASIPKACRKYFHLNSTSSSTVQKMGPVSRLFVEFKLPFPTVCWYHIYSVTRADLEEDSKLSKLSYAIKYHNKNLLDECLKQDIQAKFRVRQNSPLHEAAYFENNIAIRALVKAGADINFKGADLETPLHVAAYWDYPETIKTLVSLGADLYAENYIRSTPLREAATIGNIDAIATLILLGTDPNVKSTSGKTPLQSAARTGRIEAISTLTSLGADLYLPLPDGKTVFEAFPELDLSQAVENYNLFNSTRLAHIRFAARCEILFIHSNSPEPSRV